MEFFVGIVCTVIFGLISLLMFRVGLDNLNFFIIVSFAILLVFLWILLRKLDRVEKKLDTLLRKKELEELKKRDEHDKQ